MPEEFRTPPESTELSFTDKFVGILTSPGEVYQSIVTSEPKTSNWMIPMVLAIIFALVFTMVAFNQPAIQDEMVAGQMKQFEKQIAEGKMTQEQADQALSFSKPGSMMFMLFGSIGVIFVVVVALFLYSLVYWLIGKMAFKSTVPYGKILEVNGLAMYIAPVTTLVTLVLVVSMGSLYAQPAASLLVDEIDPTNSTHKLLMAINVFEFWMLFVTAVGLSKVWNVTIQKSLGAVGGVWLVWTLLKSFVNLGFGA
jgi:hypothetical protein